MNYKKVECSNCGKEFRKVIDAAWVIFCSDKCANESERNRKTSRKDDRNFRQSA